MQMRWPLPLTDKHGAEAEQQTQLTHSSIIHLHTWRSAHMHRAKGFRSHSLVACLQCSNISFASCSATRAEYD
jgi:hypothetical protein